MVDANSTYSTTKDTFQDPEDDKDVYEADYLVKLHNVLIAMQNALGTEIEGTTTDLKTRLARCLSDDGSMRQGTSFPSSPNEGDFFYRADENVMYIYNGSSWDAQGQSLSNLAFCYQRGGSNHAAASHGLLDPGTVEHHDGSNIIVSPVWAVFGNTYRTIITGKFKKLAGVNTVTVYAKILSKNSNASYYVSVEANIGGQSASQSGSTTSTAWEWISFNVDVSSLTDGSIYDVTIKLKHSTARVAYMDSIIGFTS